MADNRILGDSSIFYIKYNGVWCPISCEISSPMSENVEMVNTTTRDNGGWRTEKPTLQSYSISVEAVLKLDDETPNSNILSYNKLRTMKRNRTLIEWKRETFGGWYIDEGKAHITDISDSNTVGEEITFSLSLSGFGMPTITTNPNLLRNSDFETDLAFWTGSGTGETIAWSAENGGSIYIENGGVNGGFYQSVDLDAGTYSVSFLMKPVFQAGVPPYLVRIYLADNFVDVEVHTDNVWKQYKATFATDGDPDLFIIQPFGSDQNLYFDKIKLEKGATPTPWIPNIND